MLIIIEGADKTGKTTLAKEISSRMGYKYEHFGPPGPDPATEYAKFLMDLKEPTVCDRFFYGEMVYGPLLRGKSLITPLQRTVIERLCRLRSAVLIHATTPLGLVSNRLAELGDEMITYEQNVRAYWSFDKLLRATSLEYLTYQGSGEHDYRDFVDAHDFSTRAYPAKHAARYCTGIGTVYSADKVIIVGEQLNIRVSWLGLPFDCGSSSTYLDICLKNSRIKESNIYVVNANTLTQDEVDLLNYNNVKYIALGDAASAKLREFNIVHKRIQHPAYWKRFHFSRKDDYTKMLEEAACL